jgi:hypothetical protein
MVYSSYKTLRYVAIFAFVKSLQIAHECERLWTGVAVREEMRQSTEGEENDSATPCGTSDEQLRIQPGQDNVSEHPSPETVLPL